MPCLSLSASRESAGLLTRASLLGAFLIVVCFLSVAAIHSWQQHRQILKLTQAFDALNPASLTHGGAAQRAQELALSLGGSWETVADTGSMEPTLKGGDLVLLSPAPIQSVEVGDIIVFRAPGMRAQEPVARVVHRVYAKELCASGIKAPSLRGTAECTMLRTQGDANLNPDPQAVRVGEFEGRVVARINQITGDIAPLIHGQFSAD
jgi:signal peptidase I